MEQFYECTKIQVFSNESELLVPKKGDCMLNINENYGTLVLKFRKEKKFFDSKNEDETITHKVLFY
jgi:hypothetical protein